MRCTPARLRIEAVPVGNGETMTAFNPRLFINDIPIDCEALDWRQLCRSVIHPGSHWPFTCTCGVPECGGIDEPVYTRIYPGKILWRIRVPLQYDRCGEWMEFSFRRRQIVGEIITALRRDLGIYARRLNSGGESDPFNFIFNYAELRDYPRLLNDFMALRKRRGAAVSRSSLAE